MEGDKDKIILKKIGESLKKQRENKGLSLRNLAALCNVDHSDIAKIEKGQVNITLLTLYDLSAALEVKVIDLLNFEMGGKMMF